MMFKTNRKAFTLVELLVLLCLVGVLICLVGVPIYNYFYDADTQTIKSKTESGFVAKLVKKYSIVSNGSTILIGDIQVEENDMVKPYILNDLFMYSNLVDGKWYRFYPTVMQYSYAGTNMFIITKAEYINQPEEK